jgi:small subunit ribosomal protein S5
MATEKIAAATEEIEVPVEGAVTQVAQVTMRDGREPRESRSSGDTIEKVVHINRCAKVVKGGRRFSFSALVVCGDQQGKVGWGFGKANEVADAIKKATESSRKNMVTYNILNGTIPHETIGDHGGGYLMLKPASPGTGIIAGGAARAVLECVGVKDVIGKSLGSSNHANIVKATLHALSSLRHPDEILRSRGRERKPKAL